MNVSITITGILLLVKNTLNLVILRQVRDLLGFNVLFLKWIYGAC